MKLLQSLEFYAFERSQLNRNAICIFLKFIIISIISSNAYLHSALD